MENNDEDELAFDFRKALHLDPPNLPDLVERFNSGAFKNIVVLTGAGISTSSGIADYRSEGGLYDQIRKKYGSQFPEVNKEPELVFTRSWRLRHPDVDASSALRESLEKYQPTPAHYFCAKLHEKGLLRRVYTQNIDSLHSKAGLPENKVVEVHGSFAKKNVVLYEDAIPYQFYTAVDEDFSEKSPPIDLLLVMGTSLQVAPFCALPNLVKKQCTRVLVTLQPTSCFSNNFTPQKKSMDSMYYGEYNMAVSWVKLAGRKVTLRPQWVRGKWKDQYILDMEVDRFVESFKNL